MSLATNYKDDILATSMSGKRRYNLVDENGNIVAANVHIEDVSQYTQIGDNYGSDEINAQNEAINNHTDIIGEGDISDIGDGTITGAISQLNSDLVSSITRSGTTFTAKNEDGTALFTFTQQDSNTTTGTNYAAGSIPNNTTFCTNKTVKNVYDNFNVRTTLLAANIQGQVDGNKTLSHSMADFRNLSISLYTGSEQLSEGFVDLALFKSGGLSVRINYYDGSTVYNIVVSYVSDTTVRIKALYPSTATLGCRIVGYN